MGRPFGPDPRPNAFMCIPFTLISALGVVVFFKASDEPVGGLFVGLTCIYICDFAASLFPAAPQPVAGEPAGPGTRPVAPPPAARPRIGTLGERGLGFFHLATGLWLMYLTWARALNFASGLDLPL